MNIMKEVHIEPKILGNFSLSQAFDLLFSIEMLKNIHGNSVKVSEWKNDERIIKFSINIDTIPYEVRVFFCGDQLRITTRQRRYKETEKRWIIENKMRMHFMFAELFQVHPTFILETIDGITYLQVRVEHHAILPTPLNHVVETFMASQTERELNEYKDVVEQAIRTS